MSPQEHNVAKVEVHVNELFEKSEKNEKGLADSLDILERKVHWVDTCSVSLVWCVMGV